MTKIFLGPAAAWTAKVGIAGLLSVGLGIYWLINKRARLRDLAELRRKLAELRPSDPEYGAVRALYTSMVVDAERWSFFHSGSGDDRGSDGDHAADGGSGGGNH
ncbi:hypothetical protein SE91_12205 [Bradyrhizobium sp. DOA1]|nr:hypothetical protein SE91_12205 [Bradyrhizobium sp. DOA1]